MKLLKSDIKCLFVKNIEVNACIVEKIETGEKFVLKDALFYEGIFNAIISFDYNTKLPTRPEALDYIKNIAKRSPDSLAEASCVYADYDEMKFDTFIDKKQFKQLKKSYNKKKGIY